MSKPTYMGTYKGMVLGTALTKTRKTGYPQFNVRVFLTDYFDAKTGEWVDASDENITVTAYLTLYGRKGGEEDGDIVETLNHTQVCTVFKWDGKGFDYLLGTDFTDGWEVQVRIEENEKSKLGYSVEWIDTADADPNVGLKSISKEEAKELESQFQHLWLNKGKKTPAAASAPAKKRGRPKKNAETETEAKSESSDTGVESEADRKKKLLEKSKRLRAEQQKEKDKKAASAAPPDDDDDTDGETGLNVSAIVPEDYDKGQAWVDVNEAKDEACDADTLKSVWKAAIKEISDTGKEKDLDATGWWTVKDQVIAEVGSM